MSKEIMNRLIRRIEGYRDQMVAMQKELTAIVALGPENGGTGEWKRAHFLREQIQAFGLSEITEYNAPDDRVPEGTRPNLVVRLQGVSQRPTVWIMVHMDVVPAGDEKLWKTPPFEATVQQDKIFGRGVEDNQQDLISALFAMRALCEEKIQPKTDVGLMLVSDEETGNRYGIKHLLQVAPNLVTPQDIVMVPDAGSPDGSMIEVAEKSILWCEFTVTGKQVHASMPHAGTNAHRAGSHLAVRLDLALHETFARKDPLFDPPESSFELTKRDANVPNINTIPGTDRFCLDCRILPDYDLKDVLAIIHKTVKAVETEFKVRVQIDFPQRVEAAPATPEDSLVVRLLSEAVREVLKVEPHAMGIGGGTVGAVFREQGIPAAVWSKMDDVAHQPNEHCVINNMVQDAQVFAAIFARDA